MGDVSPLRCLQPINLDLDVFCEQRPEGTQWPPKHRHKLAYIVHHIVREGVRFRDSDPCKDAPGIQLNTTLLRELLGKGKRDFAGEALRTLRTWGVIELAGNHRAGFRARRYRLAGAYAEARTGWRCYDAPRLTRKLAEHEARETKACVAAHSSFAIVHDSLGRVSLHAEGRAFADQALAGAMEEKCRTAWLASLREIEHPDRALSTSSKTNRLYHPVSSCPKELRRFLLIDGEEAAEVDMGASQFYLLLSLYHGQSEERDRFGRAAASGLFYEHLCKLVECSPEARKWGDTDKPVRDLWSGHGAAEMRGRFKVHALRSILYERLYPKQPVLWQRFAEAFPELASGLALRRYNQHAASEFCCEMQRKEAGFMFGVVLPRLSRELPACSPVTIHDGILCQARFAEDVRRVIQEEGRNWLGAAPAVSVKRGQFAESVRAA